MTLFFLLRPYKYDLGFVKKVAHAYVEKKKKSKVIPKEIEKGIVVFSAISSELDTVQEQLKIPDFKKELIEKLQIREKELTYQRLILAKQLLEFEEEEHLLGMLLM